MKRADEKCAHRIREGKCIRCFMSASACTEEKVDEDIERLKGKK